MKKEIKETLDEQIRAKNLQRLEEAKHKFDTD